MAPEALLLEEIEALEDPVIMDEVVIEEMTIDCICGVY